MGGVEVRVLVIVCFTSTERYVWNLLFLLGLGLGLV